MPSTRRPHRALTLAVVACVGIAVVIGAVAATPGSGQQSATTGCFPGGDSIEHDEAVGDVVAIEMLLCFEGSVTIEGPGYQGTVNLSSRDKSGQVTLRLNTHINGSDAVSVTSDTLQVRTNVNATGSFEPGNYTLVVRDGTGTVTDKITFELAKPGAEEVRLWRAPRGAATELRTVEDVVSSREAATQFDSRRAVEDPDTSDTLYMATNETLVVAIEANGLEGAMKTATGSAITRFRTALRKTGSRLLVEQARETVTPERAPLTPDVLNSSATQVVPHPQNDTYYLIVDTSRLYADRSRSGDDSVHLGSYPGSKFAYRFTMEEGDLETIQPSARHGADYRMIEPSFGFARVRDGPIVLPPGPDQRVRIRTILAPGTNVTVTVTGGVNRTVTRIVGGQNGTIFQGFTVPLDLSEVPNGTTVTFQFGEGDSEQFEADVLRAVVRRPKASLRVRDDPLTSQSLALSSVHVSHRSVAAVYAPDGTLVGTKPVGPGATEDVYVPLTTTKSDLSNYRVVLFRDADRSRSLTEADERYRIGGVPVAATITSISTETVTATEPVTSTATPTATVTSTRTHSPTDTATSTEASTPGFGVVTTLVALAGSLLLGKRSQ